MSVVRRVLAHRSEMTYVDIVRVELPGLGSAGYAAIHVQVREDGVGLRHSVVAYSDDEVEQRLVVCTTRCLEVGE